jgi:ceramide glucosyltransferase
MTDAAASVAFAVAFGTALGVAGLSLAYSAACVALALAWRRRRAVAPTGDLPPVSVLKPLCGLEPELEENLRSFCDQRYPAAQIVFGARAGGDPALAVARRVAADFPGRDVAVVAGDRPLGANRKVNLLAALLPSARHDVVVVADSDVRVGPTYLRHVAAPLRDPAVGLVTCLYRAAPTPTLWSRLEALAVDEGFLPSVLVSLALGSHDYCSGATTALRREVLDAIGGFEALGGILADDHELGARVSALGLRVVVSRYEVTTTVHEPGPGALVAHELRWMRTIRASKPLGHALLFVTYALPTSLLAASFAPRRPWVLALPLLALALRAVLHHVIQYPVLRDAPSPPRTLYGDRRAAWLVPLRDLLSFGVWAVSFASRRVVWRDRTMRVRPDGVLIAAEERRSA